MISFEITSNSEGLRADRFLFKATNAPSSIIYKAFRKKDVKLNGKWICGNEIIHSGDRLCIYISDEFRKNKSVSKCALGADIVFEDDNIIIFNKPPGLPCQSDRRHTGGTLSEMLKSYMADKKEYFPEKESSFSPALCNRLDINTGGLVIGAKNSAALREMNEHIRLRRVRKFYICMLEKVPKCREKHVSAFIVKNEKNNKSIISDHGKEISMDYRIISENNGQALAEVELHTGRSHQIRAYFSSIGAPLCGDRKYGAKEGGGQKLFAYKLIFDFEAKGVLAPLSHKIFEIDYYKFLGMVNNIQRR